ncbi:Hypothetical Protein FCC1311_009732 [Hondaea fermentalgiana]|uniref:Uncharacterized protein n=1 Tax=Hondaea fermentalgiana TaxID=2315210 RepID=A0A2R5G2J0_9STRA|nr:Hypothetical Protein FCC1311_009732 [Hondaea fermentalgiana]|eukprot:GBG24755.1 Hypothetical Protein FCC1311_009732 [Hondaea fermentalgiana]
MVTAKSAWNGSVEVGSAGRWNGKNAPPPRANLNLHLRFEFEVGLFQEPHLRGARILHLRLAAPRFECLPRAWEKRTSGAAGGGRPQVKNARRASATLAARKWPKGAPRSLASVAQAREPHASSNGAQLCKTKIASYGGFGGMHREGEVGEHEEEHGYLDGENNGEEEEEEVDTSDEEGVRPYEEEDLPFPDLGSPRADEANREDCGLRTENGSMASMQAEVEEGRKWVATAKTHRETCEEKRQHEDIDISRRASLTRALEDAQQALASWYAFKAHFDRISPLGRTVDGAVPSLAGRRRSSGFANVLGPTRKRSSGLHGVINGIKSLTPRHRRQSSTSSGSGAGGLQLFSSGSNFSVHSSASSISSTSYTTSSHGAAGLGASVTAGHDTNPKEVHSHAQQVPQTVGRRMQNQLRATGSFTFGVAASSSLPSLGVLSRGSSTNSESGSAASGASPTHRARRDSGPRHVRGTSDGAEYATGLGLARSLDEDTATKMDALLDEARFRANHATTAPVPDSADDVADVIRVSRRGSTNAALVSAPPSGGVTDERAEGVPRGVLSRRWRHKLQACDFAHLLFLFQWHPQFARVALFDTSFKSSSETITVRRNLCKLLLTKLWHRPDASMAHRWAIASVTGHALLQEFSSNPEMPLRSTSIASNLLSEIAAQPLCVTAINRAIKPYLDRARNNDASVATAVDLARHILDALLQAEFPAVLHDVCRQIGRLAANRYQRVHLVAGLFFFLRYVNRQVATAAIDPSSSRERDQRFMNAASLLQTLCTRASTPGAPSSPSSSQSSSSSSTAPSPLPSSSSTTGSSTTVSQSQQQDQQHHEAETEAKSDEGTEATREREEAFLSEAVSKLHALVDRLCVAPHAITFAQSHARAETLLDLERTLRFERTSSPVGQMAPTVDLPESCVTLSFVDLQLLAKVSDAMIKPLRGGKNGDGSVDLSLRSPACVGVDMDSFAKFVKPRLVSLKAFAAPGQKDADNLYIDYKPLWVHAMPISAHFASPLSSPTNSPPTSPSGSTLGVVDTASFSREAQYAQKLRVAYDSLLLL